MNLANATPITGLRFDARTANGALANALLQSSAIPDLNTGSWQHGRITTANDELFGSTHFSEPMTNYAVGWADPEGYDALAAFLAPEIPAPGELFEHMVFNNAEEFLSDGANEDLRAINAEFKTVDYTQSKTQRRIPNRGLRIELDWDRVKNDPIWQQRYTGKLLSRLKRNKARRAVALAIASGTAAPLTWKASSTTLPDVDLNNQRIASGDASGISPNRLLIGEPAWQARLTGLSLMSQASNTNSYAAAAMLNRSVDEVGAFLGMGTRLDSGRYQSGSTKQSLLGASMLMFTGQDGADLEDPTNFKTAWFPCQNGTRYAVYVRQLSVKKWEIVVECYELLFCASTLGVRYITIANS